MARMLSPIASVIRGSIGGLTFFANQFHQIVIRQRTSPVNPKTTFQSQIRGAFGDASVLYEALSDADRILWEEYADGLTYEGPTGEYSLPGRQVAMSNVATALYADDRGIDVDVVDCEPPLAPGFLSLSDLAIAAPVGAGTGFSISMRNNNAEDIVVLLTRSRAFPVTRYRFKGPFLSSTLAGVGVSAAGVSVHDVLSLNEDSIYFFSLRAISAQSPYRISPMFIIRGIASTTVV